MSSSIANQNSIKLIVELLSHLLTVANDPCANWSIVLEILCKTVTVDISELLSITLKALSGKLQFNTGRGFFYSIYFFCYDSSYFFDGTFLNILLSIETMIIIEEKRTCNGCKFLSFCTSG